MTTPPSGASSGPSPTPSSSSSNIRQPFSMSHIHQDPSRASSAASHASSSGAEKHGAMSNGMAPGSEHPHYDYSQQTPQAQPLPPMPNPGGPFPNTNPAAYLPQVTSSPPPQVPTYIPPPQHAMAPDPIHDGHPGPSMIGAWQGTQPPQWAPGGVPYGMQPGMRMMPQGRSQGGASGLPPNTVEPYPSRGVVPPANATYPPHVMMGLGGRPGSSHGDGRDRRRDKERHREDEEGRDSREDEVISTIFVVGFPDDMGEREFQNIFTFAPGFEAATLKFPSGSRRPEPTAALLAELQQIAANQQAAAAAGEHYEMPPTQPALEEALAALQMGGTASTSTSTTPSAAMSMTPSAPSGATFGGGLPQLPTRRQTIGFARFRTRADAIAAKEQLQGRKIDHLTGATLKAEMAKKNLHQKRATSGEELVGLLLRSGRLAGLMNPAMQGGMMQGIPPQPQSMAPPPVPNQPPSSAREAWNSWPPPQEGQPGAFPYSTSLPAPASAPQPLSSHSTSSTSPPSSVRSPNAPPTDSKALLALAEEADEMDGWPLHGAQMGLEGFTPSTSSGNPGSGPGGPIQTELTGSRRERSSAGSSGDPALAFSPSLNHLSNPASANNMRVPTQYGQYGREGMPNSPPGGSDRLSEGGRVMGGNPADQNPPINTLYVGNLPAISPPTHPPNFLEESLRALFSRCAGYKRMSFRQKINGPMCFVEFEDVPFAAQAIKDLYGHNLGGLVKGGIRLSYSKNSLGQRGNAHSSGNNSSLFGGIAHTVALAGMSPSSSAKTLHSPSSYGLQLSQGPPSAGTNGPSSAPIPMPDLRRHNEVTALSPTAQPFNLATSATSPRTRYFGSSPSGLSASAHSQHSAEQAYSYPTSTQGIPNSGSSNGAGGGQFSPVSPPIRTPASFSWVSSGNGNVAGVGNGGYGLDGFTWSNGGAAMQ